MPNRHVGDCTCADPVHQHEETCQHCSGCLPAREVDGSTVCRRCASRVTAALEGAEATRNGQKVTTPSLPDLWADLAERPRLAGVSAAVDGEGDQPGQLIRGSAVDLRSAIRAHLVTWSEILRDKHGMPIPSEESIARSSRSIARWRSGQAEQARNLALLLAMPAVGPLHPSPRGVALAKEKQAELRAEVEDARHERETGLDIIRALAQHVRRHLDRLLADPDDAPVFIEDLTSVHRQAIRVANPSRGANLRILCECGSRVPVDPDEIMTCPGCGQYGVISWWVANEESPPAMTLRDLHGWLITKGVLIHERKLRGWADDGIITPVAGGGTEARTFDPTAVLIVAKSPRRTRTPRSGVKDVA